MSGDLLYRALAKMGAAAERCELWASQSASGGWSTHQVDANRALASELREFIAVARHERREGRA